MGARSLRVLWAGLLRAPAAAAVLGEQPSAYSLTFSGCPEAARMGRHFTVMNRAK